MESLVIVLFVPFLLLQEHTLVGGKDAAKPQTIQLSGLGIMPEHCIIDVENEMDVYISPIPGAK